MYAERSEGVHGGLDSNPAAILLQSLIRNQWFKFGHSNFPAYISKIYVNIRHLVLFRPCTQICTMVQISLIYEAILAYRNNYAEIYA